MFPEPSVEMCESGGNIKSPDVFQPTANTQPTIDKIFHFGGKLEKMILNGGEWTFMKGTPHWYQGELKEYL